MNFIQWNSEKAGQELSVTMALNKKVRLSQKTFLATPRDTGKTLGFMKNLRSKT